jgi:molybdenum cofactor cytidylyltransferase
MCALPPASHPCSKKSSSCPEPARGNPVAVILAAGFSSRMGAFKPLLPLAGQTALERCVSLFHDCGIKDVRAVIGHRGDELAPLLDLMRVRPILNDHPEQGMFSSVRCAVQDLIAGDGHGIGPECPGDCLLLPVDIATVRPVTIARLLARRTALEQADENPPLVLLPAFRGQTGHPALLAREIFADILDWDGTNGVSGGLRGWMRHRLRHGPQSVDVADAGILMDMDRPMDAAMLENRLIRTRNLSIPTPEECSELHILYNPDPSRRTIRAHCLAVAKTGLRLASAMIQDGRIGQRLSLEVLASAALVHDLAKGERNHGQAGAAFLREHGFAVIAEHVAAHHQFDPDSSANVNESTLLQLADLLTLQDRPATLDERFALTMNRFRDDAAALLAIQAKYSATKGLYKEVARFIGENPEAAARHPVPEETGLLAGFTP